MFLTDEAMVFLEKSIRRTMTVLEFGCGQSTSWLLDRAAKVYTVEANYISCIATMRELSLDKKKMMRWRLYFVACNWDVDQRGKRRGISSDDKNIPDKHKIEMEQDFSVDILDNIDIIIVNGAIRYKTLVRALAILHKQQKGMIVVNNMEVPWREEYVNKIVPKTLCRKDFPQASPPAKYNNIEQSGRWITSIWTQP